MSRKPNQSISLSDKPALDGEVTAMRWEEKKRAFDVAVREKDLRMKSENIAEGELRREWRRKTPLVTPHGSSVPQSMAEFMSEAMDSGRLARMKDSARRELELRWPVGMAKPLEHSEEHCAMMRARLAPLMRQLSVELSSHKLRDSKGSTNWRDMTAVDAEAHLDELRMAYIDKPTTLSEEAASPFTHEPLAGTEPF